MSGVDGLAPEAQNKEYERKFLNPDPAFVDAIVSDSHGSKFDIQQFYVEGDADVKFGVKNFEGEGLLWLETGRSQYNILLIEDYSGLLPAIDGGQLYGNLRDEYMPRLRLQNDDLIFTIKGPDDYEWEVVLDEGFSSLDVLKSSMPCSLSKLRFEMLWQGQAKLHLDLYIDEATGEFNGKQSIEVEFRIKAECDAFVPPSELGVEVTGDKRASNRYLAMHGYDHWDEVVAEHQAK